MRSSVLVLAVPLLALPATAQAHFTILEPPPATTSTTNGGKGDPPCGPTAMPSNVVTPVTGGSKLTLKINEFVSHPGFYRVALSIKSRSELPPDNVVKDKNGMVLAPNSTGTSATADYQTNPVFPVLADNLFPHTTGAMFSSDITLPNVNCDKCTLQVIEFMANHGSNGPKEGFFYHHCADLKITADPSKPIFDPTAAGGAGGGSSGGASSAGGAGGVSAMPSGGTAGTLAAAGSATGGTAPSNGGSAPIGVSGGGTGGSAAVAGSPASAGSVAAGATGGQPSVAASNDNDKGGCAVSTHAADSKPLLSLLVGLLVLGRRRSRRR
jgi:MYXO-CTERM domain-containing protein